MATLPPLHTFKLANDDKPYIGFRVTVSGGYERCRNTLRSRHPQADATTLALQYHLSWSTDIPSPFVSLWKSWRRAVNWAKRRAKQGGLDIDITAVWIRDQDVYDTYAAVRTTTRLPEKLLEYHEDEVVIVDRGGRADFSILAEWKWVTERQWEVSTFDMPGESLSTSLPIGSLAFGTSSDVERSENRKARRWRRPHYSLLAEELGSGRGLVQIFKVMALILLLCEGPHPAPPVVALSQDFASDELEAQLAEIFARAVN